MLSRMLFKMIVSCLFASMANCWDVPDNIYNTYFGTISRERPYMPTEIYGEIPDWIEGYFLKQSGGTYGNWSNPELGSKITHAFDGLGTVASFKMRDGMVEYGTKYVIYQSIHPHSLQ
uniref:Uncharacterized protein LOC102808044 n=1 Tax=Saccoglossus kowalevskii TaxID=10224 RepID=A0ABM0M347_SACKO|nr:PREDICTED: uncharacterized protein LOC102808044 [Saccoglossus kowalevskii]